MSRGMSEELLTGVGGPTSASCVRRFWVAKTMTNIVSVATPATVMIINVVSDPSNFSCSVLAAVLSCRLRILGGFDVVFERSCASIFNVGTFDGCEVRTLDGAAGLYAGLYGEPESE